MKANDVIVALFRDIPSCSAQTCPEMRASEWQYLCAVHDPPKSCCAIDYCCHTLDWATNVLTSPKYFPSRLTLGGEGGGNATASMRHLTNIFRRVYRIFAHAWFQHQDVFWQVEAEKGLYIFFKTVCDQYQLIPDDNYTIPPEAEGGHDEETLETPISTKSPEIGQPEKMTILTRDIGVENRTGTGNQQTPQQQQQREQGEPTTTVSVGATTRRHKHTPSTGTNVTTIAEGLEEEDNKQNSSSASVLRDSEEDDEDDEDEDDDESEYTDSSHTATATTADSASSIESEAQPQPQPQPPPPPQNKRGLLSGSPFGAKGLGRLDLSKESFAGLRDISRGPEDPTPVAQQVGDPDPLAALASASAEATSAGGEGEVGAEEPTKAKEEEGVEGEHVGEKEEEGAGKDEEKEVVATEPSEGEKVDLDRLSESVVHGTSGEVNLGEAEREKKFVIDDTEEGKK